MSDDLGQALQKMPAPPLTEEERLNRELKARERKNQQELKENAAAAAGGAMFGAAVMGRGLPSPDDAPEIATLLVRAEDPLRIPGKGVKTILHARDGYRMSWMPNGSVRIQIENSKRDFYVPMTNIVQIEIVSA